jgi:hypothetical protein
MSNAARSMVNQGDAVLIPNQPKMRIRWKGNDCLEMRIENQGGRTESLVIDSTGSGGSDCNHLRELIDLSRFPMPLRGNYISI